MGSCAWIRGDIRCVSAALRCHHNAVECTRCNPSRLDSSIRNILIVMRGHKRSKKQIDIRLFLVFGIVLTFVCLRLSWLSIIPAGFNWDESAYAYNGFTLLKFGTDEFG